MFSLLRSSSRSVFRAPSARCSSRSARDILNDDDTPVDLSEDNDAVDGRRPYSLASKPSLRPTPANWKKHRASLRETFPDGWNPPRKLSRDAMDGLRQLHRANPDTFPVRVLAERFRVSPEAVRRILKSNWSPPPERTAKLRLREAALKRPSRSTLSALRERLEVQRVAESKADFKAAFTNEWELIEDEDEDGEAEPTRGIHRRDRLTFE